MTETFDFAHWSDVQGADLASWKLRWPNFSPREMACKGDGSLKVHAPSLDKLQSLRDELGVNINITSAYRPPWYNTKVGGARNSQHLLARAYDCTMENKNPTTFIEAAARHGFNGIGTYPSSNFIHIDTRDRLTRWGSAFKVGETDLPIELPPPKSPERKIIETTGLVAAITGFIEATGIDLKSIDWVTVGSAVGVAVVVYFLFQKYQTRKHDL